MVQALGTALSVAGAAQAIHFTRQQPVGGKPDHLAQQLGIGSLLNKRAERHYVLGYRVLSFGLVVASTTST